MPGIVRSRSLASRTRGTLPPYRHTDALSDTTGGPDVPVRAVEGTRGCRGVDLAGRPGSRPHHQRRAAGTHRLQLGHRCHHQPGDLQQRDLGRRRRLRGAVVGPGHPRCQPRRGGPCADHRGRPIRHRHHASGVGGHQRGGRPSVDRGRPPPGSQDRRDHRRGQGAVVDGRPAEHVDQDPRHRRGTARHHRRARRGHQRQRDPDLQLRRLRQGDRRLARRTRDRPRPTVTTSARSSRSRRSSSAASTAKSTSDSKRSAPPRPPHSWARRPSPTRDWPTASTRR